MRTASTAFVNAQSASVRTPIAKLEHYNASTLTETFYHTDNIKTIEILRVADTNKFFGLLFCLRLHVDLIDPDNELSIASGQYLKPYLGFGDEYLSYPKFRITEINENKLTHALSITGYDDIYLLTNYTFSELAITYPTTFFAIAQKIGLKIGCSIVGISDTQSLLSTVVNEGELNFEPTDLLKDVLLQLCEAMFCICYLNENNLLVFKWLSTTGSVVTIPTSQYIDLDAGENRRLLTIISATALGDNISASTTTIGSTLTLWDNGFLTLRSDIATHLQKGITLYGALPFPQYDLKWFADIRLELGDRYLVDSHYCYLLDDTIKFDGTLRETSQWQYEDEELIESNPNSIGDALNNTYARVDKVNLEIQLNVLEVSEVRLDISNITVDINGITGRVSTTEQTVNLNKEETDNAIAELRKSTELAQTAEDVLILINLSLSDGINEITTTTGYKFGADGLRISNTDSTISTTITEDGMEIYNGTQKQLDVNHDGVEAINLTANRYLLIAHSRFEHFRRGTSSHRTGLFYVRGDD